MGRRLTIQMIPFILRGVLGIVSISLISVGVGLYSVPAGMIACGSLIYIELTTEAFYARSARRTLPIKRT
jgi:hypothetical protein